jgi:hypothetical protein
MNARSKKKLDAAYARFEAHIAGARAAAFGTVEIPGARKLLATVDRMIALENNGRPQLEVLDGGLI